MSSTLYRILVPDAPLHRRTDRDAVRAELAWRGEGAQLARDRQPGLARPNLVSTFEGSIDRILFAFPKRGVETPSDVAAYRSVIAALRPGTRFVVLHHRSVAATVQSWFAAAGHADENVTLVPLPEYVSFTDWAEDGYVALCDASDGSCYLMEPWQFPRAGDSLLAEAVSEYCDITASQAPLIFQGGNCLIGDRFWLMGKDYFADSLNLVSGARPPVARPGDVLPDDFVRTLFKDFVDAERELILVGTRRPIAVRDYYGSRAGADYFLDVAGSGVGTYQPIFHIDMFITLAGRGADGRFEVLVGSPTLADEVLGTSSPVGLGEVYDSVARDLENAGFKVRRNPLVHRPTVGRSFSLAQLKELAQRPEAEYQALREAVAELEAAGAVPESLVKVRDWHHVTWNNCLVENSPAQGKHVYLPTFGHGPHADLAVVDQWMARFWSEEMGFQVHLLGDFNGFARRQGVVHCIKKYLARGN
jgi:hypothetical protein